MPIYEMINDQENGELINHNGKKYAKGQPIMKINITEEEANLLNDRKIDGCKYIPVTDKPKNQLSKEELIAKAQALDVDISDINARDPKIKSKILDRINTKENEGAV